MKVFGKEAPRRDRRGEIFDMENAEKSDFDAPLLEEKTCEINRLLKLEPHFEVTRAQLVSDVGDLNTDVSSLSFDKKHLEKVVEKNTTDLTDAIVQLKKRDATRHLTSSTRACPQLT